MVKVGKGSAAYKRAVKDAEEMAKKGKWSYFKGTRSPGTKAVAKKYNVNIKTGRLYGNKTIEDTPTATGSNNTNTGGGYQKNIELPPGTIIYMDYPGATGGIEYSGVERDIITFSDDTWDNMPGWVKSLWLVSHKVREGRMLQEGRWTRSYTLYTERSITRRGNPLDPIKGYFSTEAEIKYLSNLLDPIAREIGMGTIEDQMKKIENMGEPWSTALHPDTTMALLTIALATQFITTKSLETFKLLSAGKRELWKFGKALRIGGFSI